MTNSFIRYPLVCKHDVMRKTCGHCDAEDAEQELAKLQAENAELREQLDDINESTKRVLAEECAPDEKHCTCVPVLRKRIEELESKYSRYEDDGEITEEWLRGVGFEERDIDVHFLRAFELQITLDDAIEVHFEIPETTVEDVYAGTITLTDRIKTRGQLLKLIDALTEKGE